MSDVVDTLDLSGVIDVCGSSQGGQVPFHPVLLVKLVFYACCVGVPGSRWVERGICEVIFFRVLSANQHPGHDMFAGFRERYLVVLSRIFL